MPYTPEVDDYVQWNKEKHSVEGWVYYKDQEYITIEIGVKCKDEEDIVNCPSELTGDEIDLFVLPQRSRRTLFPQPPRAPGAGRGNPANSGGCGVMGYRSLA